MELAETYASIHAAASILAAIGVHPHDAKTWTDSCRDQFIESAKNPHVLAIGEIGLDYYYDHSPRDIQKEVFREQLRLAKEVNLPVIIHDRDAHEDVMEILEQEDAQHVLLHCFSGDIEMADWALNRGYFLAFGGSVTFKKSSSAIVAASVPMSHLVLETDCPYLTPTPHRGKRNEPAYVTLVAQKIAEIKSLPLDEVARITTENASRFYRRSQ